MAGDIPEDFRFGYDLPVKMSPPKIPAFGRFQLCLKFFRQRGEIQAVEQSDFIPAGPQNRSQVKESERFHPEVIGGKVMDPGIDEKNGSIWRGDVHGGHQKSFI
jgi:hypothetical protein